MRPRYQPDTCDDCPDCRDHKNWTACCAACHCCPPELRCATCQPEETPRLLDCGWCYEENGEEVHPHPECPIGYAVPASERS